MKGKTETDPNRKGKQATSGGCTQRKWPVKRAVVSHKKQEDSSKSLMNPGDNKGVEPAGTKNNVYLQQRGKQRRRGGKKKKPPGGEGGRHK